MSRRPPPDRSREGLHGRPGGDGHRCRRGSGPRQCRPGLQPGGDGPGRRGQGWRPPRRLQGRQGGGTSGSAASGSGEVTGPRAPDITRERELKAESNPKDKQPGRGTRTAAPPRAQPGCPHGASSVAVRSGAGSAAEARLAGRAALSQLVCLSSSRSRTALLSAVPASFPGLPLPLRTSWGHALETGPQGAQRKGCCLGHPHAGVLGPVWGRNRSLVSRTVGTQPWGSRRGQERGHIPSRCPSLRSRY